MTVAATLRRAGPFTGNGATDTFPFEFKALATGNLRVTQRDTDDVETDLTEGVDYAVTLNADQDVDPGGEVVLTDPLPTDYILVLTSDVPSTQEAVVTNSGGFFPAVFNLVFDKLTILIQQIEEQMTRVFTVSVTGATADLEITPVANGVLAWNSAGTALETVTLPDLSLILALPDQAGSNGKALVTDGFTASWQNVSAPVTSVAGLTGVITAAGLKTALNYTYSELYDILGYAPAGVLSDEYVSIEISNTPGFETTRISFSAGQCRDSTNAVDIILTAAISKRLDAVWAAGDTNGGRDAATALAAGQTWHCHVIVDTDTGTEDALFSQSPTAPTLPAGYDYFRRVGSIVLEASGTGIRLFQQHGDWFKYKVRSTDFAAQANGAGPYYRVVSVPDGISVEAELYFQSTGTATSTVYHSIVADPAFGAPPAFGPSTQWAQVRRITFKDASSTNISYETVVIRQWTDTTKHVYTYSNDANDVIVLGVLGFKDPRRL